MGADAKHGPAMVRVPGLAARPLPQPMELEVFPMQGRYSIKTDQPVPTFLQVAHGLVRGHPVSCIVRGWRPGEPQRCRLCPVCTAAENNICSVLVPWRVENAQAALFRFDSPGPLLVEDR